MSTQPWIALFLALAIAAPVSNAGGPPTALAASTPPPPAGRRATATLSASATLTQLAHLPTAHADVGLTVPRMSDRGGLSHVPASAVALESRRGTTENSPATESPSPTVSFIALPDGALASPPIFIVPPDTHGAAGPNHLMTMLNSQVRVQTRAGTPLQTLPLQTFWAPVSGGSGAFDPRVLYEPQGGRWIAAAVDDFGSTSGLLLAVSDTSDPTAAWHFYKVDADPANVAWADYPSIGYTDRWVTVQVNMYAIANNAFVRSQIYLFDRAALYAASPTAPHTLITRNDIGAVQSPAVTLDAEEHTQYLVQSTSGASATLTIWKVTGEVGNEELSVDSVVIGPVPWATEVANNFAPQLGLATKIDTGDDRIQNAVFRSGRLWAVHTVFLPAAPAPTRAAVQWWEIEPGHAVVQRGLIQDVSNARFFAYPSIGVNKNGDALIGFSRFAADQYASANYALRCATDPAGTFRGDAMLKAGEGPYWKTFSGFYNRWGDYSATMADPNDDLSFWTLQEYAATPVGSGTTINTGRWGTWWGQVSNPCPQHRLYVPLVSRR